MSDTDVQTLSPQDAWALLQEHPNAILIDVRANMEFLFVGHPAGAVHVPWIDEPDWDINPHFVRDVRKVLLGGVLHDTTLDSAPLVLICRSGKRSLEAGRALLAEGFTNVYNIADGFEGELNDKHHRSSLGGWRHCDLPWEQC